MSGKKEKKGEKWRRISASPHLLIAFADRAEEGRKERSGRSTPLSGKKREKGEEEEGCAGPFCMNIPLKERKTGDRPGRERREKGEPRLFPFLRG